MNTIIFRKLYDLYVLKPLWLLFIILTVFYLHKQDWISAVSFALVWWFGIGGIGGGLYPEMSAKELAKGNIPSKDEILKAVKEELSPKETYLIARANIRLSILIGFSSLVVLWHYDLKWYFVILLGILIGYLSSILIIAWWMVIIFIKRKFSK